MQTEIFDLNDAAVKQRAISRSADIINNGGVVAFPTETVYGLGADAFNPTAIKKIYEAKGRPSDNPLIVHISSFDMLASVCDDVPEIASELFKAFAPGPITIIVPRGKNVNDVVTAGLNTVGVRFPAEPFAQEFISACGTPIAAPSANLSGKPSPTTAKYVIADMDGRVDAILCGNDCDAGVESTIVDATGEVPVILRPGIITIADIRKVIPSAIVDKNVLEDVAEGEAPKCPGMKYKHYAPNAEVTVVEGSAKSVKQKIDELLKNAPQGSTIGVLTCTDNTYDADVLINTGHGMTDYAHNLFTDLRRFDDLGVDIVYAELCGDEDCVLAVKNRLYKSAAHRVIRV